MSFSLACFRQVFAAGRDMSDVENVLIARSGLRAHPNAVLKGIETQSVKDTYGRPQMRHWRWASRASDRRLGRPALLGR